MTKSVNKNVVEVHGCIVCARTLNILAGYSHEGRLLDCSMTSPGGHRIMDEGRPLVACDIHTAEEIKIAYQKWQSILKKRLW